MSNQDILTGYRVAELEEFILYRAPKTIATESPASSSTNEFILSPAPPPPPTFLSVPVSTHSCMCVQVYIDRDIREESEKQLIGSY